MKKFAFWIFIMLAMLALVGCESKQAGNTTISEATVRDIIFSVETRANGVTVVWLINDETGAYCFADEVAKSGSLEEMLLSGKPVIIKYKGIEYADDHPCKGAESSNSGSGFQTYAAESIKFAP